MAITTSINIDAMRRLVKQKEGSLYPPEHCDELRCAAIDAYVVDGWQKEDCDLYFLTTQGSISIYFRDQGINVEVLLYLPKGVNEDLILSDYVINHVCDRVNIVKLAVDKYYPEGVINGYHI